VDKSGNKGGQTLGPAVPKGGSDGKVLPLHVAQLMHRIEKRLPLDGPGGVGPNRHEPDRVHFPRLLRLDGERRGEETATDGREERSTIHGGTLFQLLQRDFQEGSDLLIPDPLHILSPAAAELRAAPIRAGLPLPRAPGASAHSADRRRGAYHARTFGFWRDFGTTRNRHHAMVPGGLS